MIDKNTTNESAAAAKGSSGVTSRAAANGSGVTREIAARSTQQAATAWQASIGSKAVAWLISKGWGSTLAKVTVGAVLGAAFGIAAALGMTGCHLRTDGAAAFQGLNPAVQIQAAEAVYTAMGGDVKYRIVPVEESKK